MCTIIIVRYTRVHILQQNECNNMPEPASLSGGNPDASIPPPLPPSGGKSMPLRAVFFFFFSRGLFFSPNLLPSGT